MHQYCDIGMMSKTAQQCCRKPFISEDLRPIGKFRIGRHNERLALMRFRTESEQCLCPIGAEGEEMQIA
jgi:hypothetical protein